MAPATYKTFKLGVILSVIDWLVFNAVFILGVCALNLPFFERGDNEMANILLANLAYVIALLICPIRLHHRNMQSANVMRNTSRTAVIFAVFYNALLGMGHYSVPGVWSSIAIVALLFVFTTAERLLLRRFLTRHRVFTQNNIKVVGVGQGELAQRAVDHITDFCSGYDLLGYFYKNDNEPPHKIHTETPITYLGTKDDLAAYIIDHHVDELYIDMTYGNSNDHKELLLLCEAKMVRVYYLPNIHNMRNARTQEFGEIYVMARYNEPLKNMGNRMLKRGFDIAVSALFLCTLFPFILLTVWIVSKITMPGPLFFKQKRTGYDGKDFYCLKFRSMKVNTDADKVQAVKDDPRITKWGSFMRHTNLDEMPQFVNVLLGDMSLVGPRPHMLAHTDYYSDYISDYMIRHFVKPGITGWAQTHGARGETKTIHDMKQRVEKDFWYNEHWSFWLDIQIMIKTITDVIQGDEKAF